jgi:hypothetical protein
MKRPCYPLTPETKEIARMLVANHRRGQLNQLFDVMYMPYSHADGSYSMDVPLSNEILSFLTVASLMELRQYQLVRVDDLTHLQPEARGLRLYAWVTLLQELFSAVDNDFLVSDYFLTVNAVGTIVHGNLTIERDGVYQSAAGFNASNVNVRKLVGDLRVAVGESAMAENPALVRAIEALENAPDEPTRREKLGEVVLELGRCMEHVSNFAGTLAAIGMFARLFGG